MQNSSPAVRRGGFALLPKKFIRYMRILSQDGFIQREIDTMQDIQRIAWSYEELVENSDDVFVVSDLNYKIQYISQSVNKNYGLQPEAFLGHDVFEYVRHDLIEDFRAILSNASPQKSYEFALELQKGIKTYFDVHISYVFNHDDINGVVLKLHDITNKKVRERELKNANLQLDQVIYKTTHDLRAPVLSALGLVNLAEASSGPEHEKYVGLIKQSLLRLDSLIEEMNNFFRNEKLALQREKIDIKNLINAEVDSLRNL